MEIKLNYSYNHSNVLREYVEIPSSYQNIFISVKTSVEIRRYGLLLELRDNNGDTRIKKLISNGDKINISSSVKDTTVGGVAGDITSGRWLVVLYIFTEYINQQQLEAGFEVTLNLGDKGDVQRIDGEFISWSAPGKRINSGHYNWDRCYCKEERWYKGDLHAHTNLSDGEESITQATENAKKSQLDFYLPTEHNLVHSGWIDTDICIVPGIEVTAKGGHFNIFGVKQDPEYVEDVMVKSDEYYINMIIDNAHSNGELVSINHPFLTRWKWLFDNTDLSKIDTIEIINDPTYHASPYANDLAIRLMDILWADGHKIYAVGGSDTHNKWGEAYEGALLPSIVGDPGTYVYMDVLTPNNLIASIKSGHIYITRLCNIIVDIHSKERGYLPGDEIFSSVSYGLTIKDSDEAMDVYLVQNSEYIRLDVHRDGDVQTVKVTIDIAGEYGWARMEIRNKAGEIRGYLNPIYWGGKATELKTFCDAKKLMETGSD